MTTYQPLFQLTIQHEYYRDKIISGLSLTPDQDTQALMQQNQLLWRETSPGTFGLYGTANLDWASVQQSSSDLVLHFSGNVQVPTTFTVVSAAFSLTELGYLVLSPNESNESQLKVTFEIGDNSSLDRLLDIKVPISKIGLSNPPHFNATLKSRTVRCQYYIIPQTIDATEQVTLTGADSSAFSDPTEVSIPQGNGETTAYLFDSEQHLFALGEIPAAPKLGVSIGGSNIPNLPFPSPTLAMDNTNSSQALSKIYVYV